MASIKRPPSPSEDSNPCILHELDISGLFGWHPGNQMSAIQLILTPGVGIKKSDAWGRYLARQLTDAHNQTAPSSPSSEQSLPSGGQKLEPLLGHLSPSPKRRRSNETTVASHTAHPKSLGQGFYPENLIYERGRASTVSSRRNTVPIASPMSACLIVRLGLLRLEPTGTSSLSPQSRAPTIVSKNNLPSLPHSLGTSTRPHCRTTHPQPCRALHRLDCMPSQARAMWSSLEATTSTSTPSDDGLAGAQHQD